MGKKNSCVRASCAGEEILSQLPFLVVICDLISTRNVASCGMGWILREVIPIPFVEKIRSRRQKGQASLFAGRFEYRTCTRSPKTYGKSRGKWYHAIIRLLAGKFR